MHQPQMKIVVDSKLDCLEPVVNDLLSKGWQLVGAPFRDEYRQMWCQSMQRLESNGNGELRLKESKRK